MDPSAKQADGIFARSQLELQTIIYVPSVVKMRTFLWNEIKPAGNVDTPQNVVVPGAVASSAEGKLLYNCGFGCLNLWMVSDH